ncbi:MAG: hypothetical protein IT422_13480 [Pirellulaceae bacterium]|jgi:hypothetical protein|nr:hypothetical protein [Pirellulaceae bacterium]
MSISDLPQRPAFRAWNESSELDRPPFSRLASVAFATGVLSLFSAFSVILLPLAMLSLGLGIAVVWKLTRDQYMAGRWLAQIGLALSATAIVWSVSARTGIEHYLYQQAGQHAKVMLQTLSAGKIYEALELKQPEMARQLTGTNLEAFYEGLPEDARRGIDDFLDNKVTKSVIAAGPSADWQFVKGAGVTRYENQTYISVDMVNRAAQAGEQQVRVKMQRESEVLTDPTKRSSTTLWSVQELTSPE